MHIWIANIHKLYRGTATQKIICLFVIPERCVKSIFFGICELIECVINILYFKYHE